jgi:signal transduction histidine kinase
MANNQLPRALSLAVHELRTPVTVVAGYLRMLLKEQAGPLNEKQHRMLEEAERSCGRISALVSELSELGRLEGGDLALGRQAFDLNELVTEMASGMHEGTDRGVHLKVKTADGPVTVAGDRARLGTIVRALMHAALRERGTPGDIVAAVTVTRDAAASFAVLAVGDESILGTLVDAARGTPPPFDEWRGGLGMALPVGRRVIDAHGGALWSAPGERPRAGSALRLPLQA